MNESQIPSERIYTLAEVAAVVSCSSRHLRRLCASGRLPAIRLHSTANWRLAESTVLGLLEPWHSKP